MVVWMNGSISYGLILLAARLAIYTLEYFIDFPIFL